MSRYRDPKATPKFHVISGDYTVTFYCQSCRVPLSRFCNTVLSYDASLCPWDVDRVAAESVRIRVAVRMDGRVDWGYCLPPAEPGDRGSFVAWAWPKPEGYPTVEDCDA